MNSQRLMYATLSVFVFIFFYEWFFHGTILKGMYEETAFLWRTESDMRAHFFWLVLGQFLIAVMFCYIFLKGYENKGLLEGMRYGLLMGVFLSIPSFVMHAVQPFPLEMAFAWIIGGIIEFILAGMLLAWVYRPE